MQTQITSRFVATIVTLAVLAAFPGAAALGIANHDEESEQYTYYLRVGERHCAHPSGTGTCWGVVVTTELWNETNGLAGLQWSGPNKDDLLRGETAGTLIYACTFYCAIPPYFLHYVIPITTPVPLPVS